MVDKSEPKFGLPVSPINYDNHIRNVIPFYELIHAQVLDLVAIIQPKPKLWLDTGCGTGMLLQSALSKWSDTSFYCADPSSGMLDLVKERFQNEKSRLTILPPCPTQSLTAELLSGNKFDVITAIQCHHYLDLPSRQKAIQVCYDALNQNGVYITTENICPLTAEGIHIGLDHLDNFYRTQGLDENQIKNQRSRFDTQFFPITVTTYLDLLSSVGFRVVELFWYSYMQAGFFAIK